MKESAVIQKDFYIKYGSLWKPLISSFYTVYFKLYEKCSRGSFFSAIMNMVFECFLSLDGHVSHCVLENYLYSIGYTFDACGDSSTLVPKVCQFNPLIASA